MARITIEIKNQIVALKTAGLSLKKIMQQLKVKKSTIRSIWKKYQLTGSVSNKPVTGRPKKLTQTDKRRICRVVIKSPKLAVASIKSRINAVLTTPVCTKTVRRTLRANKFFGRSAAKKLLLAPSTRLARLRWCKEQLNLLARMPEFFNSVLFSDEVRFGLSSDGPVWVWRKANERYRPQCTIGRSSVRRSVMYWGCISFDGTVSLIRCSNNMKAPEYVDVLEGAAIQVASSEYGLTFMDDNAPIHRAKLVKEWKAFHHVNCLNWPAYSPDLNPIENVWGLIKSRIHSRSIPPVTLAELDTAVRREWNNLLPSYMQNLYLSMKRRLQACISVHGYPTKY